jgi:hypothetical protein
LEFIKSLFTFAVVKNYVFGMSKGSSYWSTATGKIGNTVVSIVRGQRIEKAYQPNVENPRTAAQQAQRSKFACAVRFYQQAVSNLFKFAFEDRKQTESDYNAFCRHNITRSGYLKKQQLEGTFPAIGLNYVLTTGSLGSVVLSSGSNACYYLPLASLSKAGSTVGDLTACLVNDYQLQEGDILTIIKIGTTVSSLSQSNPVSDPVWTIKQLKLSASDTTPLSSISSDLSLVSGQGLYIDNENHNSAYWYGVIFSRTSSKKMEVSNSDLYGNAVATTLYYNSLVESWKQEVLTTYEASSVAVLSGSRISASLSGSIFTVAGDNVPRISETVMTAGVTSSAEVTGSGLTNVTVNDFTGVGVQVSGFVASSDTEATITLTGTGEHPYSWYLVFGGKVIAQHSEMTPQITSVSPNVVDVLAAGDTVTITVTGNYVDALKESDFTSSSANLVISGVTPVNATTAYIVLSAKANITEATVSYNGSVIITIKETPASITSDTVSTSIKGLTNVSLKGTGLNSLTAASFTKPSDWLIQSYVPSSDGTTAILAVVAASYGKLYYQSQVIFACIDPSDLAE